MKRVKLVAPWKAGLLVGLLGMALASGGLYADPSDGLTLNGPGGGVGTLPATKGQGHLGLPMGPYEPFGSGLQFSSALPEETQPALALRGTSDELDALIALAYSPDGSGWFELTAAAADGTRTITYHGNTVVLLERSVLQATSAGVALAVAPGSLGSRAMVHSGDRRAAQVLTVGLVPLPLQRAARAGLLSSGIEVEVQSPTGATASALHLISEGRLIRIEQVR